jgi:hypothetical protein
MFVGTDLIQVLQLTADAGYHYQVVRCHQDNLHALTAVAQ